MSGAYWYISQGKLESLASRPSVLGRLTGRIRVRAPATSFEVGIGPAALPDRRRAVVDAEERLRHEGSVTPLAEVRSRQGRTLFFDYEGPACRVATECAFWVAGLCDTTGVLLVGSTSNAVGARPAAAVDGMFSPTIDPMRHVRGFADGLANEPGDADAWASRWGRGGASRSRRGERDLTSTSAAVYLWRRVLGRDLDERAPMSLSSLPRARAIAQYAGLWPVVQRLPEPLDTVQWLVVGSPLFVEECGPTRGYSCR